MLLRAFAKINLDLQVLHRRADGYHEVRTILQTVDWHDEVRIEPADRFEFVARDVPSTVPTDGGNLVVKAVRAFERLTARPARVHIELTKHIPVGAGLGGGSADAAVTLMGLQRVLGHQLTALEQLECLQRLGSDVPFFAVGGRALGTGRGEQVLPLEDDPESANACIVIVHPGVFIGTAEAYSWLTMDAGSNSIEGFCAQFVPGNAGRDQTNDFERVVFARHPLLAEIKREFLGLGAWRASLSGSGSAVFGMFTTPDEASRAVSSFSSRFVVRATRALTRPEYLRGVFGD